MQKAVIYKKPWDISIEESPLPQIRSNEVLVRIRATGICGTDLGIISGKYKAKTNVILGHESAGEVVDVGSDVKGLVEKDRVVIDPTYYCNNCYMCRIGRQNHCITKTATETGVSKNGTFTQYYITEERFLYKLEDHVSFEEATMTEPLSCVLTALNQIPIKQNFNTVVLGAGPMGLLYSMTLASYGMSGALVEISEERLNLASKIASHNWSVYKNFDDAFRTIKSIDNKIDLIIDTTGALGDKYINKLRNGGIVLLVGLRDGQVTFNPKEIVDRSLTILGSIDSLGTFQTAYDLIKQGTIPVNKIISNVYPLEKFKHALEELGCDLKQKKLFSTAKALKIIIQS